MTMSSRKSPAASPCCPAAHELGLCTSAFGHRLALTGEKLASLAPMGLAWAEIAGLQEQHLNAFDSERIEELARAARAVKLKIWSYHAGFAGLAMDDAATRIDAVRKTVQAARSAHKLGAGVVVVHPGRDVPSVNRKREIRWTIEALAAVAEQLPRGMKIALETMGKGSLGGPAEEMLHIMNALRGLPVGICFDCGHVHIGGIDPAGYARAVAGWIVTVHFHDNYGDKDAHALPGEGNIDWPPMLRAIHEGGYKGPWMMESGPAGKPLRPYVNEYKRRMKRYCAASE